MKPKRIGVVTAGHLSTCPRMLKAADLFAGAGYDVHVVATRSTPWACEADDVLLAARRGRFRTSVVDYARASAPLAYFWTGARHRAARALAGLGRPSLRVAARAFARTHDELVGAAVSTGADLLYGGTTGGMAATAEAARRLGVPYGIDLEDFYSGQGEAGDLECRLARRVEEEVVAGARFLTAGSEAIAEAYRAELGVSPVPIHNVFPLPEEPPNLERRKDSPLRLYWFSQTVGPGRGLEEAIEAMGIAEVPGELHIRGSVSVEERSRLEALAAPHPRLELRWLPPAPPGEMVTLAAGYDAGLALEQGQSRNNRLALGNKVLTYLVAGLALVLTRLPGHEPVVDDLDGCAVVVPPGDSRALAEGFRRLALESGFLERCRRASWEAARRRWHWEHPAESGRLLSLVREALT